jgi:hypothetical protein
LKFIEVAKGNGWGERTKDSEILRSFVMEIYNENWKGRSGIADVA